MGVPVAHVEAGLRTYDRKRPFPEEMFRRAIAVLAVWNFAPTNTAVQNLVGERVDPDSIRLTGNTIVDAAAWALEERVSLPEDMQEIFAYDRRVLVTSHRRENLDGGISAIFSAVNALAREHTNTAFVVLNHSNPRVRAEITMGLPPTENIFVVNPLPYREFVHFLASVDVLMTDSGGLQEEAAYLGIPTVVMRASTERMELVRSGLAALAGTNSNDIQAATNAFFRTPKDELASVASAAKHIFGRGNSGQIIANYLEPDSLTAIQ
jgi:UDP-N-acetylglucosamine 2-epimerase (non-hydrolysing)